MNVYQRFDAVNAIVYRRNALELRERASLYLRWGNRRAHREIMHNAVWAWKQHKQLARRLAS